MKTLKEYVEERIKDCAQMSWSCHYNDTRFWTGLHKKYSSLMNSENGFDMEAKFESKIDAIKHIGIES